MPALLGVADGILVDGIWREGFVEVCIAFEPLSLNDLHVRGDLVEGGFETRSSSWFYAPARPRLHSAFAPRHLIRAPGALIKCLALVLAKESSVV